MNQSLKLSLWVAFVVMPLSAALLLLIMLVTAQPINWDQETMFYSGALMSLALREWFDWIGRMTG
jgi:hypothetical protein